MQMMDSWDEDFNLFLKDFMELLNKYHYVINHRIRVNKLHDPEDRIVAFQEDGLGMWSIVEIGKQLFTTNKVYTEDES